MLACFEPFYLNVLFQALSLAEMALSYIASVVLAVTTELNIVLLSSGVSFEA
jgi:hypothetical protein